MYRKDWFSFCLDIRNLVCTENIFTHFLGNVIDALFVSWKEFVYMYVYMFMCACMDVGVRHHLKLFACI